MQLRAFAKINLSLQVLGKRPDGFHELRTVFQAIDWYDEIQMEPWSNFEFSASEGPQDESNLVVRAVRMFESAWGQPVNVRIRLVKNVPAGAGLGGGSADAAVTFLGLSHLYRLELSADSDGRARMMRSLGSDVFFFMFGGRALGTGRGDQIEMLDDRTDYWLLLVHPGFSIATMDAYSWLTMADKSNNIEGFRAQFAPGREPAEVNDFEAVVFERHPALQEIKTELLRLGAMRAALSGSGSVVFGRFGSESEAEKAASALRQRFFVKIARPLSRSEYFSRMIG